MRIDGIIGDYDADTTPQKFHEELNACTGDIILQICSPGGSIFSAAEIYSMLKAFKCKVTAQVPAFAASAATVIMCAADVVEVSPVAVLCVHNPYLDWAMGEEKDMLKAAEFLAEIKESIINAYELKTGLSREKISELMTDETYLNAKKALELGFADTLMFDAEKVEETPPEMFSSRRAFNSIIQSFKASEKIDAKNLRRKILLGR